MGMSSIAESIMPDICCASVRAVRLARAASIVAIDMSSTCSYVPHMPKMIQLRHVPDELHGRLKARAALEGLSLSEFLVQEVRRAADRPTIRELRARLAARDRVVVKSPPAKAVRAERNGR